MGGKPHQSWLNAQNGKIRYVPNCVVTNDLLAQVMDTSDEWITQRSGIKERRVIPDTYRMLQELAQAPDKDVYIEQLYD